MVHHGVYIRLGEMIHRFAFRYERPDEFMVPFSRALLERGAGITVEQPGAEPAVRSVLYGIGIGELRSVVSKANPEDGSEQIETDDVKNRGKDPRDGSGSIGIAEKSEHQLCFGEMDGEQDLAAPGALNRIQLSHGDTGVVADEGKEILVRATDAAPGIDFFMYEGSARLKTDFSWQVDVHGGDTSGIDQPVDGTFADGDDIGVGNTDMMRGLSLPYQRRDKGIDRSKLFLGKRDAPAGVGQEQAVPVLGKRSLIELFFYRTERLASTSVADIGRFGKLVAVKPDEVIAEGITEPASSAE